MVSISSPAISSGHTLDLLSANGKHLLKGCYCASPGVIDSISWCATKTPYSSFSSPDKSLALFVWLDNKSQAFFIRMGFKRQECVIRQQTASLKNGGLCFDRELTGSQTHYGFGGACYLWISTRGRMGTEFRCV